MSSNPRTLTFLFTDLENSTPLWEKHPDLMQELAARHDALIREAMDRRRAPFYLRRTKEAMVHFPERRVDGSWAAEPIFKNV